MSAERCAQPVQGPRGALATALTRERSSADAYRTASTGLRGAVERHAPSLDDVTEGLTEGGPHSDATPARRAHARRSAAAHIEGNLPATRHHPNHDCIRIASWSMTEGAA